MVRKLKHFNYLHKNSKILDLITKNIFKKLFKQLNILIQKKEIRTEFILCKKNMILLIIYIYKKKLPDRK